MSGEIPAGRIETILASPPLRGPHRAPRGEDLGRSRQGRPVEGFRFGSGPERVSLLAGCHADEPVGPLLLRRLVTHLAALPDDDPLLANREWWIVPQANPDGEARNAEWQNPSPDPRGDGGFDLASYLAHQWREPPGEDLEFGFPRDEGDEEARPETRAIHDWWRGSEAPFTLHVSLHGMGFGAGPWLLLEPAWWERTKPLRRRFLQRIREMGYRPHDVDRQGEKGFMRLGPGFATRPDSSRMRDHFMAQGDPATAHRFRPSSMEAVRRLGGDPLTLVTEMPLFLTPGVGWVLGPPDPVQRGWRSRIERWRVELDQGRTPEEVRTVARNEGLLPMPVRDQATLQWAAVEEGLRLAEGPANPAADAPSAQSSPQDPGEGHRGPGGVQ